MAKPVSDSGRPSRFIASSWFWLVPFVGQELYVAIEAYRPRVYYFHGFEQVTLGFLVGTAASAIFTGLLLLGFLLVVFAFPRFDATSGKRLYFLSGAAGMLSMLAVVGAVWSFGDLRWVGLRIAWFAVFAICVSSAISFLILKAGVQMGYLRPVQAARTCDQCGYDLQGLEEARCPECGTPFDPKLLKRHVE